jgi:hypothetical protein
MTPSDALYSLASALSLASRPCPARRVENASPSRLVVLSLALRVPREESPDPYADPDVLSSELRALLATEAGSVALRDALEAVERIAAVGAGRAYGFESALADALDALFGASDVAFGRA